MRGQTVLMKFSDGSVAPIPTDAIKDAREAGAVEYKPARDMQRAHSGRSTLPSAGVMAAMDVAPAAGSMLGSVGGGILGGAIGGPAGALAGRSAGGMAGGALGKAAQEGMWRMAGLGDAPGTVAGEAAAQGVLGATGEALGGTAGLVGRGLIRSGLPARVENAGKVVGEMIRERIPIGLGGGKKATEHWARRAAERNAVNVAAEQAGALIPRATAENTLAKLIKEASDEMAEDTEVRYFQRVLDSWRKRKSDFLTPTEVQRVVTRYNKTSRPVFKALGRGESIPTQGLQQKATQRMAIADAFGEELEKSVPGWREATDRLATAISTKDAVKLAERQPLRSLGSRLATGSALGAGYEFITDGPDRREMAKHGAIGAAIGAGLASPALTSRTGLLLNDPFLQMVLQQAPRAYGNTGGK